MPKYIAINHDAYLRSFSKDKTKFTKWIKKTYALTREKFIINVMTFVKLTTTFDTGSSIYSYVAYAKVEDINESLILFDMWGKIIGVSKRAHDDLCLQTLFEANLDDNNYNIIVFIPSLVDYFFPATKD